VRINLGLFQRDVNVMWDLAVHDLSIMDYVLPSRPRAVSATGAGHVNGAQENVAYLTLFFDDSTIAHVHVNWLAPVKVRRTLIGGSRKMIVYDDLESEKVKVYDRGVFPTEVETDAGAGQPQPIGYRSGDVWAPELDATEPLRVAVTEFLGRIDHPTAGSSTDGHSGLRIVRILEAASRSLRDHGRIVEVEAGRCVA
jgi:predicted dehydrogenase